MAFKETSVSSTGAKGRPECIIVSNRGPVEYYLQPDNKYYSRYGSGGLVTALLGAVQQHCVAWIALTMTEQDRLGFEMNHQVTNNLPLLLDNVALRLLSVPQEVYNSYYFSISNRILWFAQHALLEPAMSTTFTQKTRDDWEKGYCAVNKIVAEAVIRELKKWGSQIPVIFQDYQLYLAAKQVRAAFPDAHLGHIIYIPWPDGRYLGMLPEYMIQSIYQSMTMNDIIGFQTQNDARNFLNGATSFLADAQVIWDNTTESRIGTLFRHERETHVHLYPVPLSRQYLHSMMQLYETNDVIRDLRSKMILNPTRQLILRVDRVEPTKNIIRGFQAYEHMLQLHPELQGNVIFLALLVPSRENLTEYSSYEGYIRDIIEHINTKYGREDWQPVIAIFGNNRVRALISLQYYDVLLVNPLIDGMNLVVKEGGILNERSGVIVLSRTTGVHDTLGNHVLSITPLDISATADALYRALTMSPEERKRRGDTVREVLMKEDATQWFDKQIRDLTGITF
jgi:trehalose 6-phosphate synthase